MSVNETGPHIREVAVGDSAQLRPLLEHWVRDSVTSEILHEEIDAALASVEARANGDSERFYVVAESVGREILGLMGYQDASEELMLASGISKLDGVAAEIINAYVKPEARGKGIGKLLVSAVEWDVNRLTYDEIVVRSGPRYKETGWPFWTALYGEPIATQKDFYGPGADAMIWKKRLRRLS